MGVVERHSKSGIRLLDAAEWAPSTASKGEIDPLPDQVRFAPITDFEYHRTSSSSSAASVWQPGIKPAAICGWALAVDPPLSFDRSPALTGSARRRVPVSALWPRPLLHLVSS